MHMRLTKMAKDLLSVRMIKNNFQLWLGDRLQLKSIIDSNTEPVQCSENFLSSIVAQQFIIFVNKKVNMILSLVWKLEK
jgi:hypothetical protein